ncbi:hypothetical protein [Acinetobacter bereziniae]|uniref:hypothetical protein n=1 Tax=Acinetobacter bereziniae TaxID=106648 RepID=UPI00125EFD58|nr:hypothetical protein [Acinetobacter bereziniae]
MDKLNQRQLTLIKRAAEDAIHACNRHYGPFVDVVAHPLNIIALVEMAQSRQAEINQLQSQINEMAEVGLSQESAIREKDKRIEEALFQMRQQALSLKEDCDGYKDPVGICQSEGIDWCVRFLEKALRGEHE